MQKARLPWDGMVKIPRNSITHPMHELQPRVEGVHVDVRGGGLLTTSSSSHCQSLLGLASLHLGLHAVIRVLEV